jgi:hypothetical protein
MGTQGSAGHTVSGGRGDVRGRARSVSILVVSLTVLPFAAGCSGSSLPSFGSSNPQAAVPPPPNSSVAATGQPAYAPPPGQPAPQAGAYAAAPPAQAASEGATVGSFTTTYVNFLKAFRDPEPGSPDARPPATAQQSAGPQQQNAYVPHPPSTYVPSGQPYAPPAQQPAYAAPANQQNYAQPPQNQQNPQRPGQQSSAATSTKQAKAARASSQQSAAAAPAQPAAAPAPVAAPVPPPAAPRDYSDSMPYPKQSLADVFRGSTESQPQSVPHPPSTYTPSGQPYTPQGQAAAGAAPAGGAVAAAPAGGQTASDSLPYPKQSLFEVFSNNK